MITPTPQPLPRKRGGPRPGSGRKPIYPGAGPLRAFTVHLTEEQKLHCLTKTGTKTIAAALRQMVEQDMESVASPA